MKRIVSLLIALLLVATALVACGDKKDNETTPAETTPTNTPVEKTYSVAIAVDSTVNANNNKVSNTALVLVLDDAGKIVAARFDCSEVTPALNDDGTVKTVASVDTKVELGDAYTGMPAGSWAKQTKAFEDYIVGKTPAEVAALDASLIAGCTMQSSTATFKALVAEAAASTLKVTFKTSEAITAGIAISTSVSNKGKVSADFAGVVMAGGKVAATVIDSAEHSFTVAEGVITAGEFKGTKNEQGDTYNMPAGPWYKQAQAFANATVGKTAAELANLEPVSDALAAAGCTMKSTTAGYKTTIIAAVGYAR